MYVRVWRSTFFDRVLIHHCVVGALRILGRSTAEPALITNSVFTTNVGVKGGAIYGANCHIVNCTFEWNDAYESGGAIYHTSGAMNISQSVFRNLRVQNFGGAVFSQVCARVLAACISFMCQ